MPCVPLMVALALVASGTHRGNEPRTSSQQRERNQQRGNRNGFALGCSGTLREGKEPAANRGNGINNKGIGTPLPWLVSVALMVAVVGSAMSVVPIDANAFALAASGTLRGNEPAAATEGTESQRGNRNGLALWLTVMVVAPIAGTPLPCRFCDVGCSHWCEPPCLGGLSLPKASTDAERGCRSSDGCPLPLWLCDVCCSHCRNALALPDLFPESNCGMVAVAPMVALAVVAP